MQRAASVKAQRLYLDSEGPVGVLSGFRLSPEDLEAIGAEADEWDLVSDDGGDSSIPVLLGQGNDIAIRPYPTQEEADAGLIPLGQDYLVWRSREELSEWLLDGGFMPLHDDGSVTASSGPDLVRMAGRIARGDSGDLLHEAGRSADLGTDPEMEATHTDVEQDDIENVDTRPKQGSSRSASAPDKQELTEAISEAVRDARSRAKDDDVVGETFPVLHEGLWASYRAELTIDFPDDSSQAHLVWLEGGDGEPIGYSAPISSFSPEKAAEAVLRHVSKTGGLG